MALVIFTLIMMGFVTLLILIQAPKQETLGNAFNGEIHTSRIDKNLRTTTFTLITIVAIVLLANQLL